MAFDAGDHGLAQRYFSTALRAVHQVNDKPLAAHILADLAFQAASREHPADAVTLGEAAARTSDGAPAGARASVLSRLAYAYATAGRTTDFDRTREDARQLVESSSPDGSEPRWMYYLTGNHLDCQAGYALIQLGRIRRNEGATAEGRRLIAKGTHCSLLGPTTYPWSTPASAAPCSRAPGSPSDTPLSARRSSPAGSRAPPPNAWPPSARHAVPRSSSSSRIDLRRRRRNPHVRSFLPELERGLAKHPAVPVPAR